MTKQEASCESCEELTRAKKVLAGHTKMIAVLEYRLTELEGRSGLRSVSTKEASDRVGIPGESIAQKVARLLLASGGKVTVRR